MVQPRGMKIRIFCGYFFSFSKLYAGGETRINHTLSSKEDHFVKEKKAWRSPVLRQQGMVEITFVWELGVWINNRQQLQTV